MAARQKLLLLKDVEGLGREGDVVTPKAGFARNYLLPRAFGILADKKALQMQARLLEQRAQRLEEEKKEALALASKFEGVVLTIYVKVDQDGHMYGSVSHHDIVELVRDQLHVELEKKWIHIKQHFKSTGVFEVPLRFKEDVQASFTLKILPEGYVEQVEEEAPKE